MKKQLLLALTLLSFIWIPARAQSFYADLNYQSFRPFIHFQLEIGNRRPRYNTYRSSYLKGYMDGVNSTYFAESRFYDLVRQIDAYEAGYRDGLLDQQLYCRLRGYRRLPQQRFGYNDYYSPGIAVKIWLNDLTFNFLRAPEPRLPRYWAGRAQPSLRSYRARFKHHRYFSQAERRYKRNQHHLRNRARGVRKKYRRSHKDYRNQSRRSRKLNRERAITRVRNYSRGANGQHKTTRSTNKRSPTLRSRPDRKTRAQTHAPRVRRKKVSRQRSRSIKKNREDHRRVQRKHRKNSRARRQKTPHKIKQRHRPSSRTQRVKHSRHRSRKNGGHRQKDRRGGHH